MYQMNPKVHIMWKKQFAKIQMVAGLSDFWTFFFVLTKIS